MDTLSPRQQRQAHLREKLRRELGPRIIMALEDDDVLEIHVNEDGALWLKRLSTGLRPTGVVLSEAQRELAIGTVAALVDEVVNSERPRLKAELPLDGSRLQAWVRPIAAPSFFIRKHPRALFPFAQWVETGRMQPWQRDVLRQAIAAKQNIIVAGETGSGKTELANAIMNEVVEQFGPYEKIILLEDTQEMHFPSENLQRGRTCEAADLRALVQDAMRMLPNRIIVGEVRGAEALELLKAWNTGHEGGVTTVHANSAAMTLLRLEMLVAEAGVPPNPRLIAGTIHLIVFMKQQGRLQTVKELVRVDGWDPRTLQYQLTLIQFS